jgi:murein DD-endopeptidase MepM/ murein hydrolase activator NlpD
LVTTVATPFAKTTQPVATIQATQPPARTYTIQDGDNLWSISQRHGVAMEALAAANRLAPTAPLRRGMILTIPAVPAEAALSSPAQTKPARATRPAPTRTAGATATHVVQAGETLWEIAKEYETSVEVLSELNDLGDSDMIRPGQRLTLSGRTVPRYRQIQRAASRPARPAEPDPDESMLKRAEGLSWPSRGTLTSRFGWRYRRHHDGIDVAAPWGTPIQAARDGMVIFVGWHGGYGKVVFVAHGDGVVTVYGHASKILVNIGDQVKQGQVIANVGCTGACTGSHLHFEVRVDGRAIDPLKFLQ